MSQGLRAGCPQTCVFGYISAANVQGPATVLRTDQCLQMPLYALVSTRTSKRSHRCLASLQNRLRLAYRIDRDSANGNTLQDFQSASIQKNDTVWSTHGAPIGRTGDHGSYTSPLLSFKDYTVDTLIHAAFSLTPSKKGANPERDSTRTPENLTGRSFSVAKPACRPLTSFKDSTPRARAPCKRSCHFPRCQKQNPRSGFCGAAAKPPALPMTWYPARPIDSVTNAIFKAAPTRDSAGYPKPRSTPHGYPRNQPLLFPN